MPCQVYLTQNSKVLLLRAAKHLCHEGVVSVFNIANLLIAASDAVSPFGYKSVGFSAQVKKKKVFRLHHHKVWPFLLEYTVYVYI